MNVKNKKLLILLVAAVIVAVLAGFLTYRYLTRQKTTVYMFNSNYATGEVVDMAKLQTVTVDASIMAGGRTEPTDGRLHPSGLLRDTVSSIPLLFFCRF